MVRLDPAGKRLVVIGGGISGLSFVHYLRNFIHAFHKDHLISKITILEASDHIGGAVVTKRFDDGVNHELGPRFLKTKGIRPTNATILIEQLGLDKQVEMLLPSTKASNTRYVYVDKKMFKVPNGIMNLFHKIPNTDVRLFSIAWKELKKIPSMSLENYPEQDPPLYDFIGYRFGQSATDIFLGPFMRAYAAGDVKRLSTRAHISDVLEKEQKYGSIIGSMYKPPIVAVPHDGLFANEAIRAQLPKTFNKLRAYGYTLSTGLQSIPERLTYSLLNTNEDSKVEIFNKTEVTSVHFNAYGDEEEAPCSVEVVTVDKEKFRIEADHIVAALPSTGLMKLLQAGNNDAISEAFNEISAIEHNPIATACLEFRGQKRELGPIFNSSNGYITHEKSDSGVLGSFFDTNCLPDVRHDIHKVLLLMGGPWYERTFGTSDMNRVTSAQIEEIALKEVRTVADIKSEPYRMSTRLWKSGLAHYEPGHNARVKRTREKLDRMSIPITLIGQSYDGLHLGEVAFSARRAADAFVSSIRTTGV